VGGTLSTVFLLPGARKALPLRFDWSIVREAVPFGLKSWAAGLGQFVNVRADQLLMTRLVSPSQLGLYAIAVTASGVLVNPFASALAVATVPRFATGDTDLIERTVRVTLLAVLLTSVGSCAGLACCCSAVLWGRLPGRFELRAARDGWIRGCCFLAGTITSTTAMIVWRTRRGPPSYVPNGGTPFVSPALHRGWLLRPYDPDRVRERQLRAIRAFEVWRVRRWT
jgi:hypothetical protein